MQIFWSEASKLISESRMDAPLHHPPVSAPFGSPGEAPSSRSPVTGLGWAHAVNGEAPLLHHGRAGGSQHVGLRAEPSSVTPVSSRRPLDGHPCLVPLATSVAASSPVLLCSRLMEGGLDGTRRSPSPGVRPRLTQFWRIGLTCPLKLQLEGND